MQIKTEIENHVINGKKLIRLDGYLNSPLIMRFINQDIYQRVVEKTSFLPEGASASQRWWHIKNNQFSFNICYCGKPIVLWHGSYSRFCSHVCAVTSIEAKERTRTQKTGNKLSKEHCIKISKRQTGAKRSAYTRQLLSVQKRGSKNPNYGKVPWNKGLYGPENPNFGKKRINTKIPRGKLSSSYGRSPNKKCGYGIQGSFKNLHFRSSLELLYLIYWYEHNVYVESAECGDFRIEYHNNGELHTYTPDFYLPNRDTLVEVKPEIKQEDSLVQTKFYTLKFTFEDMKCVLLGYREIKDFIIEFIYLQKIYDYIGIELLMEEKQLVRLIKNYGGILREVRKVI